jgi:hypothetical protein
MKMAVDNFLGGCDWLCLGLALEECEVEVPLDKKKILKRAKVSRKGSRTGTRHFSS